jgi:hypothetical protein
MIHGLLALTLGCATVDESAPPTSQLNEASQETTSTPSAAALELHAVVADLPEPFDYVRAVQPGPWPESHHTFGGSVTIADVSGNEVEITTRWPRRPDPETGRVGGDDGPPPPPRTNLSGHLVRVWDAPTLVLSWELTAKTTVWLEHPTADPDSIPDDVIRLLDSIIGVDEDERHRMTGHLPAN